jgi:hypothetical protein
MKRQETIVNFYSTNSSVNSAQRAVEHGGRSKRQGQFHDPGVNLKLQKVVNVFQIFLFKNILLRFV